MKLKKAIIKTINKEQNAQNLAYNLFLQTGNINYYLFYRELEKVDLVKNKTQEVGNTR